MTVRTWLRNLFVRPARRPARRRLSLEALEDRTVPSTAWYVNAAAAGAHTGTSWANAYTDLQAALASARPGDQVWVAQGVYKPTGGTDRTVSFALKGGVAVYGGFAGTETQLTQRVLAQHVSILSGDIGAPGDGSDNSYHVVTSTGLGASAVLDGFTIAAGNANANPFDKPFTDADLGGGMYNKSSSPTLRNVTFTGNNAASFGGGMYNLNSAPSLSNVAFIGNSASVGGGLFNTLISAPALSNVIFISNSASFGGGMYNLNSAPSLSNVTFSVNSASRLGGGMFNNGSSPTLSNVTFGNNRASDLGGGMYDTSSAPALSNVTFRGNAASNQGGGLYNLNSAPALSNVTFSGNSASVGGGMSNRASAPALTNVTFFGNLASIGGGVDNESSSPALTNVTFIENQASSFGGGMYNFSSSPTLTNVTFTENRAADHGGGMYNFSSSPTLTNCILWRDPGGEIYNSGAGGATVRYSDVQGGYSGTGNLSLDPRLGPLQNNGGPTQTIALLRGSPAIDAGNSGALPAGVTTDQRGFARVSGAAVDLGAYEVQMPAVSTAALPDGTYGTAYRQTLSATEGPGGAGGPYTFVVTAGALPPGLSLAPGGALSGTPTATGSSAFTITATDSRGFTASHSYTLTIDKARLTITAANESKLYGTTFTPDGTSQFTTSGLVNGDTVSSVTLTSAGYADTAGIAGSRYAIVASAAVGSGLSNYTITYVNGTLTVAAPLSATAVHVSATAGAPFSGTVATFTTPDQTASAAAFRAAITWGDGRTSSGVVTGSNGSFSVSGTHTYAAAGSYAVSVQIVNLNIQTVTVNAAATVTSLGQGVTNYLTEEIAFWHNNGQALIHSFNGGPSSTALANWLAASFPNLYGAGAGANDLAGLTNAQVASYFNTLFNLGGTQVQAQVLATALSVYATTSALGGTAGEHYYFLVSSTGLGARSFRVFREGAAFGVANGTVLNVYQLLLAVNQKASNGVLYGGNATLQADAASLFNRLIEAGDID